MTADLPTDVPASGWFPDPNVPGQERWWDGEAWGEQIRPRLSTPTAATPFDLRQWIGQHRTFIALAIAAIIVVAIVGAVATGLRGGGYNRAEFEQGLMSSLNEEIDSTRIQKVECPATASTSTGSTFECFASAIDGNNLVVKVTFQDDEGGYVWQVQ